MADDIEVALRTQGGGIDATNPQANEAEQMATNTEQIGEEVAAGIADDA